MSVLIITIYNKIDAFFNVIKQHNLINEHDASKKIGLYLSEKSCWQCECKHYIGIFSVDKKAILDDTRCAFLQNVKTF